MVTLQSVNRQGEKRSVQLAAKSNSVMFLFENVLPGKYKSEDLLRFVFCGRPPARIGRLAVSAFDLANSQSWFRVGLQVFNLDEWKIGICDRFAFQSALLILLPFCAFWTSFYRYRAMTGGVELCRKSGSFTKGWS